MGMAAGQARFLGLTARKTNVEYEGQQINQQRTTLSNQSATYNNQLLAVQVPTAPSVESFTKLSYSWTSNNSDVNTITNLVPIKGSTTDYNISYNTKSTVQGAYAATTNRTANITRVLVPDSTSKKPGDAGYVNTYGYQYGTSGTALKVLDAKNDADAIASLNVARGTTKGTYYSFTDATANVTYFSQDDLDNAVWAATSSTGSDTQASIQRYVMGAHTETTNNKAVGTVDFENGRMCAVTIGNTTYTVDSNSSTDEDAYNNAMNQYEYQKDSYNKQLNDINAKLSIIQQQDKSLELKLRQLDTEQQAISTEMDAVKKVIDKNIESGFKTFNA